MPNHKALLASLVKQDASLSSIYASMSKDLASVLKKYKITNNSKLWFKNLAVKKEVEALMKRYQQTIFSHISKSVERSWELSNLNNDVLVNRYIKGITIPNQAFYYQRNTKALQAFLKRRDNGLNLSDRVWNLTNQTQSQIEYFIAEGLTEGRSAVKLAGDLQRYLKKPEKRFRRLRNPVTGKLILSNPAENYQPGRGVYRSSYKKALRLARNEINIAYRTSDFERRKQLPFVLGVTVNLSPAHPAYDICDELQGDYPKAFRFTGWHPNCLCFTTTKLASKQDFIKHLKGQDISNKKQVRTIPNNAAKYLKENSNRLKGLNSKPYFLADNFKHTDDGFVLKKSVGVTQKIIEDQQPNIVSRLKDIDVTVNSFSQETFKIFNQNTPDFDFVSLFTSLERNLNKSNIKNINKSVWFKKTGFEFKLTARDFEMQRKVTYNPLGNSVYHAYLRLPRIAQGSGLTKKMFQTLYKQYEAGNISKINVTANIDIGGYAWARYGFSATDKEQVLKIINKSGDSAFKKIAKRKVNYHYKKYGDRKPFPMIRLANISGGKKALLSSLWSGTIDLKNKKELNWFLSYLFK